jgi:hypothetical protein
MADATRELVISDFASKADITALRTEMAAVEQRIMAAMEKVELRLTVRLGGLIAVGIAILAAIIKL